MAAARTVGECGSANISRAHHQLGRARAALDALPDLARRSGAKRPIRVASTEEIEKELAVARKLGVRFVALAEPDYPPALQEIELRAADSRAPGPRGGPPPAGGRDRGLPQRVRRGLPLPSGWRVPWDRPVMSSSQGWRAGSISTPVSPAWKPAASECSPADMQSPIPTKLCR